MLSPFLVCLTDELTKRRYGEKRQAEIVDRFNGLREGFVADGAADPDTLAMTRVLAEVDARTAAKARVDYATLIKLSRAKAWIEGDAVNTAVFGATNEKGNPALALNAMLSRDARLGDIPNVEIQQEVFRGMLWAAMNDVIKHASKGVMGIQRGKAHLENVVHEIFGLRTGDETAAVIAKSFTKGSDMVVDLMNHVGGAMTKLDRWGLPQMQSLANVVKKGGENGANWVADHMQWLDWDRMRWPNGAPIKPDERAGVLQEVYKVLASDGVVKLKPGDFGGNGSAMGNMLDNHRFMIFKDGASWIEMNDKYGSGSAYDVMLTYIDKMAHRIALTDVFSANPEHFANTLKQVAVKFAENSQGHQAAMQASTIIKNKFEPMFDMTMRRNSMDPESTLANVVLATGNVLRSIQLSGATVVAMPGDFATTATWAAANGMKDILPGLVGTYAKTFFSPIESARLSAHYGFVWDETVATNFSKARFSGLAEHGPEWSKRLSDVVMRASGLGVHTNSIRSAMQKEFMHMMARDADKAFDALPYKTLMERYGIDAAAWDKVRKLAPDEFDRIRPLDLLAGGEAGRPTAMAFQTMIMTESRYAVPDTTMEASAIMTGGLRPDTIRGALLHSVSMYKNFPATIALMYGRVAMALPDRGGRLSYIAGLGTSLILGGATGMQLREMSKGRDPLDMTKPSFWGKALLSSGALSIWGDFVFGGVNTPQSSADIAAGPLIGFAGDTAQLAGGSMFEWADKMGTLKENKEARTPFAAKAVEYASRYTPGVNNPLIRAALQREIFDNLRMMSDPRGYSRMMQKERERVKKNGNMSWWEPGSALPSRPPDLTAIGGTQ